MAIGHSLRAVCEEANSSQPGTPFAAFLPPLSALCVTFS
jgi:hypothetical protein